MQHRAAGVNPFAHRERAGRIQKGLRWELNAARFPDADNVLLYREKRQVCLVPEFCFLER